MRSRGSLGIGYDIAVAQANRPRCALRENGIMRYENDGRARFAIQRLQQIEYELSRIRIEIPCWLVGKENPRRIGEGSRDRDTLLLASGQLHRKMVAAISQSDALEELVRARGCAFDTLKLERDLNVLARCQGRYELKALKDKSDFLAAQLCALVLGHSGEIVTVQDHLSSSRCIETSEKSEQRCLSASGRADDCDESTLRDGERYIAKNGDLEVAALVLASNFLCNEHEVPVLKSEC
jgi:hypothetical protein